MYGFIIRYKKTTLSRGFLNGSPSRARLPIKFLTEFFCRPGSRFLPCVPWNSTRTNKNIAPPFSPYRRQSSLPALGLPLRLLAKQCGLTNQQSAGKSAARRAQKNHAFAWLFKWLPE